jgi:hypothetical protein
MNQGSRILARSCEPLKEEHCDAMIAFEACYEMKSSVLIVSLLCGRQRFRARFRKSSENSLKITFKFKIVVDLFRIFFFLHQQQLRWKREKKNTASKDPGTN